MSASDTTTDQRTDLPTAADAPELYDTLGVDVSQPDAHTDADPQAAIDAIERPQTYDPGEWATPTREEGALPRAGLPGFGEETPTCGEDVPYFCAGCGHTTTIGDTCRRMSCPRCVESAIRERTTEVCARLGAFRATLDYQRDPHQKYHHVVLSPPKEWVLLAEKVYKRTVDVIKELFRVMGLVGWYAYHPWAGKDGDDRGAWKRRINSGRDLADVMDELKHRPHFHAVVICDKVPGGDFVTEVNDATDWVITRIVPNEDYHDEDHLQESGVEEGYNSNVSIYGDDELARAVSYIISHTGLERKETPNGVEHHLMANYIGSIVDYDDDEVKWWPEVIDTDGARWDDQRDRMDAIVRAAAPTTLGVAAENVQCRKEWLQEDAPERDYEVVDVVGAAARSQGNRGRIPQRNRTELPKTTNVDAIAGEVAVGPGVDAAETELPEDLENAVDGSAYEEPEPERCRGRLLHISSAHQYLEDAEWLEDVADPVHVLSAYRTWNAEHPDALEHVDVDAIVERAERRLGIG